ncbi:MAG: glycosyltransferase [Bacteriovoracaceae bacterium]
MKVKLISLKYHSKLDQFIIKTLKDQFVVMTDQFIESLGGDISGAYPLIVTDDPDYENEQALIFKNFEETRSYAHDAELTQLYVLEGDDETLLPLEAFDEIITLDTETPKGWIKIHEHIQFGEYIHHYMKTKDLKGNAPIKPVTPKNVCFFNSNRAWGGGEKWHLNTAKFFKDLGHKIFMVTNIRSELEKKAHEEKIPSLGFYIHNLSFLNPFKLLAIMSVFREEKTDAVIMNLPSDLKLGGLAAKFSGVKKIVYRRGMPHPLRNTWLNRFLFTRVLTDIIVNSEEIGRSLVKGNESWFPQHKLRLLYNGVDTSRAIEVSNKIYEREGDEIVLGNAGRLTSQKGQKYLIELASLMVNAGVKFKLLIAGTGELEEELKKLISDNNLENEVKLLGHVDDMPAFFNSLDAFVFTSLYEGSANTLIETLWYRVPTVAWDISSNPEIILHQQTGYLARPFDIEDLYRGVEFVLKRTTIDAGSELVKKKFDTNKNLSVLKNIIS